MNLVMLQDTKSIFKNCCFYTLILSRDHDPCFWDRGMSRATRHQTNVLDLNSLTQSHPKICLSTFDSQRTGDNYKNVEHGEVILRKEKKNSKVKTINKATTKTTKPTLLPRTTLQTKSLMQYQSEYKCQKYSNNKTLSSPTEEAELGADL